MSGGHFDYAYSSVNEFSTRLREELAKGKEHFNLNDEVFSRLLLLVIQAEKLSTLMHAAEWLMSGDFGNDDFIAISDTAELDFLKRITSLEKPA